MGFRILQVFCVWKKSNFVNRSPGVTTAVEKNRAHKQYRARLTRWLDRLSHFDVNVQYTAGKNIPLTDYLSRHPIIPTEIAELENIADGLTEAEAEEEFVINQIYGLLELNEKRGSIERFTERNDTTEKFNKSQSGSNICERNRNTHLLKTSP